MIKGLASRTRIARKEWAGELLTSADPPEESQRNSQTWNLISCQKGRESIRRDLADLRLVEDRGPAPQSQARRRAACRLALHLRRVGAQPGARPESGGGGDLSLGVPGPLALARTSFAPWATTPAQMGLAKPFIPAIRMVLTVALRPTASNPGGRVMRSP